MCCHFYELLGPSVLPVSRFYLQLRIGNLFLWYMFLFCTEPSDMPLQVLRLPGSASCCKTWDETAGVCSALGTRRPFHPASFWVTWILNVAGLVFSSLLKFGLGGRLIPDRF